MAPRSLSRLLVSLSVLLVACERQAPPTISQLHLTPEGARLAVGVPTQFEVLALMSDGSSRSVTTSAGWSVDDAYVFDVDDHGVVTGLHEGATLVRARVGDLEARQLVTITPATLTKLELGPLEAVVPVGVTLQVQLTALYSDGSRVHPTRGVSWLVVGDTNVASMQEATGTVVGTKPGAITIEASFGGFRATLPVTISPATVRALSIAPTGSIAVGLAGALHVSALLSDGTSLDATEDATWASGNTAIASVSNESGRRGRVLGRQLGTSHVTARLMGLEAGVDVTVSDAVAEQLAVSHVPASVAAGERFTVTAEAVFSDRSVRDVSASTRWTSSDEGVFTVTPEAGAVVVHALRAGSGTLRATFSGATSDVVVHVNAATPVSMQVMPGLLQVPAGLHAQLVATVARSDGSTTIDTASVVWSSDDETIATISNQAHHEGEVTAVRPGSTTLRGTLGPLSVHATLTVTNATLVAMEALPVHPTLPIGTRLPLTATGHFSDGTSRDVTADATWASSDPSIVWVSDDDGSKGSALAQSAGTATVSVTFANVQLEVIVDVTGAVLQRIELTPSNPSLPNGLSLQLEARGFFSDGTTQPLTNEVTWTSANDQVVSVSNAFGQQGVAQSHGTGVVRITAELEGLVSSTLVEVTMASLISLELTPAALTIPAGLSADFHVIGQFSDGSAQDMTADVEWSTSDAATFSLSSLHTNTAYGQALAEGSSTVEASFGGVTASVLVYVSPASLRQLTVTPASVRIANHTDANVRAIGTWTDGHTRDVTSEVTWAVDDASIAQFTQGARLVGSAPGTATLQAQIGSVVGSGSLVVTDAVLLSLSLSESMPSVLEGRSLAMRVNGIFSDGSSQDVSALVSWQCADAARLDAATLTAGLLTGTSVGSTQVTASFLGVSVSTVVTVTSATPTVVGVSVSTLNLSVLAGESSNFTISLAMSDGSRREVSQETSWTIDDPTVVSVSSGVSGVTVNGLRAGTTALRATVLGFEVAVSVDVQGLAPN